MDKKKSFYYVYGLYGGIGVQLAASIVAGFWLGHYGDKKWGTLPWLSLVGILLGTVGGFYNMFRLLKKRE